MEQDSDDGVVGEAPEPEADALDPLDQEALLGATQPGATATRPDDRPRQRREPAEPPRRRSDLFRDAMRGGTHPALRVDETVLGPAGRCDRMSAMTPQHLNPDLAAAIDNLAAEYGGTAGPA